MTKKVTQARKGLGTNSVGLATELSLVSRLLQKVIPKKRLSKLRFSTNSLIIRRTPNEVTIAAGATLSSLARASISRKRKIHFKEGKYKQRGSGSSTLSSGKGNTTCAWIRVKDYPKQHFAIVSGNLRCNSCNETLSLQKSLIDKRIKSSKHTNGVARITKDKKQSQSIMDCVKRRDMR